MPTKKNVKITINVPSEVFTETPQEITQIFEKQIFPKILKSLTEKERGGEKPKVKQNITLTTSGTTGTAGGKTTKTETIGVSYGIAW